MLKEIVVVSAALLMLGTAVSVATDGAIAPTPLVPQVAEAETFDSCVRAMAEPHNLMAKLRCALDIAAAIWRNGEGSWTGNYDG